MYRYLFIYLKRLYFTGILFLKQIYRDWKPFFWMLLLLMGGQAFFMLKKIQNLPFFLYEMYSRDHQPRDSFAVYLIKTPDGYFNHKSLSGREQEMLMNSLAYYNNLQRDGDGVLITVEKRFRSRLPGSLYRYVQDQLGNDSLAMRQFPQWWGRYFNEVAGKHWDSVAVVRSFVYRKTPFPKSASDSVLFTVKTR